MPKRNKPPKFTDLIFEIEENSTTGSVVVFGSDYIRDDKNEVLTFSFNDPSNLFSVDPSSGDITFVGNPEDLDFETNNAYTLVITVDDGVNPPVTQTVKINLIDVDETLPPPAAPTVDLDPRSDTGLSDTDNVTSDNLPRLEGTAERGTSIEIFDGAMLVAEVATKNNGTWNYTFTTPLTDGDHSLSVKAVNGTSVSPEVPLSITIDTTSPLAPVITSVEADNGSLATDGITNDPTLVLSGTGEAGTQIEVFEGNKSIGTTTVDGAGNWSFDNSQDSRTDGVYQFAARATDLAGNSSPESAVFQVIVDTIAPSAPTIALDNDTGSSGVDGITNDGAFTVSGTEAGAVVEYSTDGGTTWNMAVPVATEGANSIDVRQTDVAGNISGTSNLSFTLDTTNPAAPSIALDNDTGSSSVDGITNDGSFTVSGTEAGAVVEYSTDGGTTWNMAVPVATEGVNSIDVRQTDVAGNTSATSNLSFTLDTLAPAAPTGLDLDPASDTGTSNSDDITADTTPTINGPAGSAEPNSTVTLFDTGGSPVLGTTTAAGDGSWSIISSALSDGVHDLTATSTDAAGNESPASSVLAITIDTGGGGDTQAPILQSFTSSTTDGTYGPGDSINITANYDEDLRADSTLSVVLSNGEAVVLNSILGTTASGSYTVGSTGSGQDSADLTVASITSQSVFDAAGNEQAGTTLPGSNVGDTSDLVIDTTAPAAPSITLNNDSGSASDDGITNDGAFTVSGTEAGAVVEYSTDGGTTWNMAVPVATEGVNSIDVRQTDVAGNTSATSNLSFTLDTTPPAMPSITGITDDTGASNSDGITNDQTLVISGTAEANSTVEVFDGVVSLGTVGADVSGNWSFNYTGTPLSEGDHSLTATATDVAGNTSVASSPFAVDIDITTPTGVVDLDTGSDTGSSDTDNITNDTTPTLSVLLTDAEAGDTVELLLGGSPFTTPLTKVLDGTDITNGFVDFTVVDTELGADGVKNISASLTDIAGNSSTATVLPITLDTTNPAAPVIALDNDTGSSSVDGITNDGSFTVSGTEAGAVVEYSTDGGTTWNMAVPVATEGVNSIDVRQTDVAGNISGTSNLSFTLDTLAPAAPTGLDLDPASDTGTSNSDDITADTTPTINGPAGSAEPNSTVTLFDTGGSPVLGTTTAAGDGSWSIISSALSDGVHDLTATSTDAAGNESPASSVLAITIDTGGGGDTQAPILQSFTSSTTDGTYGPGDSINITANYDEDLRADSTLSVVLSNGEAVILNSILGTTASGSYTVGSTGSGQDSADLTVASITSQSVFDAAGNEQAGTTLPGSNVGDTSDLVIDTAAPAAPSITLNNDSGSASDDGITNNGAFTVSGTEAGAVVEYSTDGGTTWNMAVPVATEGANSIDVRQTDVAGNISGTSNLSFTLDTTNPAAPSIALDNDTGSSSVDGITNDGSFTVSGTEAGAVVEYSTDGGTTWNMAVPVATEGVNSIDVRQTDVAGNTSATSNLSFTLDTLAPAAPSITGIADDTGVSNSDGVTNDQTLVINGTAEANSTVEVFDGVVSLGTTDADGSGNWSFDYTGTPLVEGDHSLTATATDVAGNTGVASSPFAVDIDITTPTGVVDLDTGSDTGSSDTDNITNDTTPTLSVLLTDAEAGDTVELLLGGSPFTTPLTKVLDGTDITNGFVDFTVVDTELGADGVKNISASLTDIAGNSSTVTVLPITLDTTNPAAPSIALDNDTGSSSVDGITNDGSFTVSGTEAGAVVEYSTDGGTTWNMAVPVATEGANSIDVRQTDVAGNISATSNLSFTLDTTNPAAPSIALDNDTGSSSVDGITNDGSFTVSGTEAGAVVEYSTDGGTTWNMAVPVATEGVNSIDVRQTDVAGNISGTSNLSFTLDTLAPAAPTGLDLDPASDTGTSNSDDITADTTPTINGPAGSAEPNSTVTLFDTGGSPVLGTTTAAGDGSWSIISSALSDGVHDLTATSTDAAGNESPASSVLAITIDTGGGGDTQAPILQSFTSSTTDGTYGPGDSINITANYDEDLRADSTLSVVLSNGEAVVLNSILGTTASGSYTVGSTGSGQDSADLTVASITSQSVFDAAGNEQAGTTLPGSNVGDTSDLVIDTTAPAAPSITLNNDSGSASDDGITNDGAFTVSGTEAGAVVEYSTNGGSTWSATPPTAAEGANSIDVRQTDVAGNISSTNNLSFTLDTSNPAAPTIALDNDTGASGVDGITNDGSYTVTGTEAGSVVEYSTNGGGTWSATPPAAAEGANSIDVRQTDVAGNTSASSNLSFTLDTTNPAAPTIALDNDTGSSGVDGITNDGTYNVTGTEAGAVIEYSTNGGSTWSATPPTAAEGANSIDVRQTDVAGNISAPSNLSFTLDTTNPAAPTITLDTDSGSANDDGNTNVGTYSVTGTEAGAVVEYSTNGGTTWSTTAPVATEGANSIDVRQTDVAGNISATSNLSFTLDTTPPAMPSITGITDDTGASNSDGITNDQTLVISGTAEANSTVEVFDGVVSLGTVGADVSGNWSFNYTGTPLSEGDHSLTATATDVAGNTSVASSPFAVDIDITTPTGVVDLDTGSDTGSSNTDDITNDTTPTFSVALTDAEAGDTVELLLAGASFGTPLTKVLDGGDITAGSVQFTVVDGELGADGVKNISASLTDLAGNSSTAAALPITLDTTAPAAPSITGIADDTGASNSDGITNDQTLVISGTAEANSTVEVFDGVVSLGTVGADVSGNWSFNYTGTPLSEGDHSLTATATDVAGNTSVASSPFAVDIDITTPTGVVDLDTGSDTGSSNTDDITNDTTPTFSVALTDAEAGDTVELLLAGASFGTPLTKVLDGGDITAGSVQFTVVDGELGADGVKNISASLTDLAGNSSTAAALPITLDTTAPAAPSITGIADDTGASNSDGITNDQTLVISGTAEANSTVEVFDGVVSLGTVGADGSGNWSFDYTGTSLSEGDHILTATATDTAGNTSDASSPFAVDVDITTPTGVVDLVGASDSGISDTDDITNDTTPTFQVLLTDAEAGDTVELLLGGVSFTTPLTKVLDGTDITNGFVAFTVVDGELGADGVKNVSASLTDVAGNSSTATALPITLDTTNPAAPTGLDLESSSDSGAFDNDDITNDTTPTITGMAEVGSTVVLFDTDGTTQLGSATTDGSGVWSIASSLLADGIHTLSAQATDIAGNTGPVSSTLDIEIDSTPPAQPSIGLDASSDSGSSDTDDNTNITTPTVSGVAEINSLVEVFDGAVSLGTTFADASGDWSLDLPALADAVHNLTATATDIAGNTSSASVVLAVTVDTIAPLAPAGLDLTAATDSGDSDTDNLTNSSAPVITGTAEAGSTVKLFDTDGVTVLGSGLTNGSGIWSITSTQLGTLEGPHTLTATATDVAGNESTVSSSLVVTIDLTAPNAPAITGIADDTGSSPTDGITSDQTLVINGTAEANSTVAVSLAGTGLLGSVSADAGGNWSFDYTGTTLLEGSHSFTATATDAAGNTSVPSGAFVVEVDTTAPLAPTIDLDAGSDTGDSDTDNLTNDTTLTLTGTAEANTTVEVLDGVTSLGTASVDGSGDWTFTTDPLTEGAHTLTAAATDTAGNVGPASGQLVVTIDLTPLAAPTGLDLDAASDTGTFDDDDITGDNTPQINGVAPANSNITLYDTDQSTVLGNVTADGGGNWSITASTLADGVHTLYATTADPAGNESAFSTGLDVTIDTSGGGDVLGPVLESFTSSTADGTYGPGSVLNITATYDEALRGDSTLTVVLDNGESIVMSNVFGSTITGSYTVGATGSGEDSGDLTVSSITTQTVFDVVGNPLASTTLPVSNLGDNSDIVVDTTAPNKPIIDLENAGDTGSSIFDNITNDNTLLLRGSAEANSTVEIFDGVTSLGTTSVSGTGQWNLESTALSDGPHNLTVEATDAAGNTSVPSDILVVTIDTAVPAAPAGLDLDAASDTGTFDDDDITSDTTPTINGTAEVGTTVTLYDTDGTTELGSAVADGSGDWAITSSVLAVGAHTLTARTTDVAGNESVASASLVITIDPTAGDTDAPVLQSFSSSTADGSYGPGSVIDITANYDESLRSDSSLTVVLNNTEIVTLSSVSGAQVSGTYTVGVLGSGEDNADLSVASITSETVYDLAGNLQDSAALPASNVADTSDIVVDTTAPAAPTLDLQAGSDTGDSDTDNLTNDDTPTFEGTGEANSTVELFDGVASLGTAGVDGTGNWTFTTSAISEGSHDITAVITDAANNVGPASSILVVEIDLTAPEIPAGLDLTPESDTGTSNTDNITSDSTPTITGTADSGALVKLYDTDNVTVVGSGIATGGTWSITTSTLSVGVHDLSASASDAAGNESALSGDLSINIDNTITLPEPVITAIADDNGASASDGVTSDDTLTLSGTADPSSTVELFIDGGSIGTTPADGVGNWSFNYTTTVLAKGTYTITATATDGVSTSPFSQGFVIQVIPPINWTDGFGDDQWLSAANWIDNQGASGLPGTGDYVRISNVDVPNPVTLAGDATIGLLEITDETVNVSSGGTLTIEGIPEFDVSSVNASGVLNVNSGSTVVVNDVIEIDGTLNVTAGTIQNGIWDLNSDLVITNTVNGADATLNNVIIWGNMSAFDDVTRIDVFGDLEIRGENGTGAGTLSLGNGSNVERQDVIFQGTQDFIAGDVVFDQTSSNRPELRFDATNATGDTFTLGPDVTIRGGNGEITITDQSELLLQGTINADTAIRTIFLFDGTGDQLTIDTGGTVMASGGTFRQESPDGVVVNNGTVSVTGGAVVFDGSVTNNNTATVTGTGALTLGSGTTATVLNSTGQTISVTGTDASNLASLTLNGDWGNDGTIDASFARVTFGGSFAIPDIGDFQRGATTGVDADDGEVRLSGAMDLGNPTQAGGVPDFTLDAETGGWEVWGGSFNDGILKIDSTAGAFLSINNSNTIDAAFNNVIIWGDLNAFDDVTRIDVTGDLEIRGENGTGAGTLSLGNGSNVERQDVIFQGTQDFIAGDVVFDQTSSNRPELRFDATNATGDTFTLGPDVTIRGGNGEITITDQSELLLQGTINADTAIRTIFLFDGTGDQLTIDTGGTVMASGGTFRQESPDGVVVNNGTVSVTGGAVVFDGSVTNNNTATVTGTGALTLGSGTTATVLNSTGQTISVTGTDASNLASLTLNGDWDNDGTIDASFARVTFGGSFAIPDIGDFQRGATTGVDADDGEVRLSGAMDLGNPTQAGGVPDFTLDAETGGWEVWGGSFNDGILKIDSTAGAFLSINNSNTIDAAFNNVIIWGDLNAFDDVTRIDVTGDLEIRGEDGTGAGTLSLGNGSTVERQDVIFQGTQDFIAGDVVFDQISSNRPELRFDATNATGDTFTIGSDVTIRGGNGEITITDQSELLLQGTINADTAIRTIFLFDGTGDQLTIDTGGTVMASGGTFRQESPDGVVVNNGTVSVTGGAVVFDGSVTNNNTATVTGTGALTLGSGTTATVLNSTGQTISVTGTDASNLASLTLNGDWDNDGTIDASFARVTFGGSFAIPDIGDFQRGATTGVDADDGEVRLSGAMDLGNPTQAGGVPDFTLDAETGGWEVWGGSFNDGILKIDSTAGAFLSINNSNTIDAAFNNVIIWGDLNAFDDVTRIDVTGDLEIRGEDGTGAGTLSLGNGSTVERQDVIFQGTQDFIAGDVVFDQTSSNRPELRFDATNATGDTFTLGPDVTIRGGNGEITITDQSELLLQGTINADTAIRTIFLFDGTGDQLTIDTGGTVMASGGTFRQESPDGVVVNNGTVSVTGGAVVFDGSVTNNNTATVTGTGALTLGSGTTATVLNSTGQTISVTGTDASNLASLTLNGDWDNDGTIDASFARVTFGGSFAIPDIGDFQRGATTGVDADDGEVRLSGAMDLGNPTQAGGVPDFTLDAETGGWEVWGGSFNDGILKIDSTAGAFLSINNSNTIDAAFNNVIIWGDISAPDDVTRIDVTGDLEIRGEDGTGAGTLSLGNGSTVERQDVIFQGTQDFIAGDVVFDQISSNRPELRFDATNATGDTFTIGSDVTIRGGNGEITITDQSELLLQGTINADTAIRTIFLFDGTGDQLTIDTGGTVMASGGTFRQESPDGVVVNNGTVSVTAGEIAFDGTFTNNGLVTLTGADAANLALLTLNGDWDNDGTIDASHARITLGGSFAVADIGTFERGATTGVDADDGEVRLSGAMDLGNPTKAGVVPDFTLDAETGGWEVWGGSFNDGILKVDGTAGAFLTLRNTTTIDAAFNNVIIWGDVSAPDDVTRIDVTGDLEIRGEDGTGAGILALGDGGTVERQDVIFQGTQDFIAGDVVFDQTSSNRPELRFDATNATGDTFTLGSDVTIRGGNGEITITDQSELLLQGIINADTAGRTIFLLDGAGDQLTIDTGGSVLASGGTFRQESPDGLVVNNGTVSVTDGAIIIDGDFVSEGTVDISGINSSFSLNSVSSSATFQGSAIFDIEEGATVTFNSGSTTNLAGTAGDNVTVNIISTTTDVSSWDAGGTLNVATTGGTATVNVGETSDSQDNVLTVVDLNVGSGGTLQGIGLLDVTGTTTNNGGTINVGNSPGILDMTGDFNFVDGVLLIEIEGTSEGTFDRLNVGGETVFSGGVIEFDFYQDHVPQAGDSVTFLESAGGISLIHGDVAHAILGVEKGFAFDLEFSDTSATFIVLNDSTSGDSTLFIGSSGDDDYATGSGEDILDGGAGDDFLAGGDGADWFVFDSGDGDDTIADFTAGQDLLVLTDGQTIQFIEYVDAAQDGVLDTLVNLDSGDTLLLSNVSSISDIDVLILASLDNLDETSVTGDEVSIDGGLIDLIVESMASKDDTGDNLLA